MSLSSSVILYLPIGTVHIVQLCMVLAAVPLVLSRAGDAAQTDGSQHVSTDQTDGSHHVSTDTDGSQPESTDQTDVRTSRQAVNMDMAMTVMLSGSLKKKNSKIDKDYLRVICWILIMLNVNCYLVGECGVRRTS